jgi:hypothetical protein
MKNILLAMVIFLMTGCTDLDETVYDIITSENYYQTSDDIIRASVRSYEHAYACLTSGAYVIQEDASDQLATLTRRPHWLDGQRYHRLHQHTWTIDDDDIDQAWNALFNGICQANTAIDDFAELDPVAFGMTKEQFVGLERGLKVLRCWYYIQLFDLFRNIPIAVSFKHQELNTMEQAAPQQMFDFIEKELKESLPDLLKKASMGGNRNLQGQWTQAGAAALLVRLYLNAEKWIGTPKYTECAEYAQKIINGEYGPYAIADRWDAPYDWDNDTCDEVIFGFSGTFGRSHWHYAGERYWWALPTWVPKYLKFYDFGNSIVKFGMQPGRDLDGNIYPFELGKPIVKFQKYPEDYRLKLYKNLGNSQREGMFLFGYLEYEIINENGEVVMEKMKDAADVNVICLRDQAGWFDVLPLGVNPTDKESTLIHSDENSGWSYVKYPFYPSDDPHKIESDYSEIRLAEVYYSLAECKFRSGDVNGAGKLLNDVRKRYYPAEKYAEYLYAPDGTVMLTESELLDEWGREFLAEGRRRTDLCRWNKFTTSVWWDKQPDIDSHTDIFPLSRNVLGANQKLKQNPGYDDIER